MWSLAQTLERIRPHLAAALVPEPALARVAAVAGRLPAPLTNCVYLERWLQGEPARVDLIVRVGARGRPLLADGSLAAAAESPRARAVWERLARFAREWETAGHGLGSQVESLWLEFDLPPDRQGPGLPAPRLFVDFTRDAWLGPTRGARLDPALLALRALGDAGSTAAEALGACVTELPPGGSVPYIGVTLDEAEPSLRACVQGLGPGVAGYLRRVGWPGDVRSLDRELLAPLARAKGDDQAPVSVVHLDLGPRLSSRIGLEYSFARPSQERGRLQEGPFLDHLVARGWCAPALRDALRLWPGRSIELLPHEIWHSRVRRRLGHVKLVRGGGAPGMELKAYLCFSSELLPAGTVVGARPRLFGPRWRPSAIG